MKGPLRSLHGMVERWKHGKSWSRAERAASAPPFLRRSSKSGIRVAATDVGNDAAAEAFRAKTGASAYRWDAGDFEACAEVMAKSILPLIPVGRLGEPRDIVRAVVFLAADEASFITGSTLSINGGQHMS
jgi:NAD(P)-dependent dehydrogenase (short-subunit alcohol dehydrogenase family)